MKKSIAFQKQARDNKDDEAMGTVLPRRNAGVLGSERAGLIIDPGPQTIAGENAAAVPLDGAFQGTPVNLGELRTDAAGRLLFLGGRGVSASPTGQPIYDATDPNAFINANGWYDDTSDGPVTASVRIQGREIPVDPAWVLTAPSNYGPGTFGVRTLYDLLLDVFADVGWIGKPPSRPSFRHDVYPTLQRLSGLQWVNRGFAVQYGPEGAYNFDDPAFVARLARDPHQGRVDLHGELRRQVRNAFRLPQPQDGNQLPWPWIYGDGMESPAAQTPSRTHQFPRSRPPFSMPGPRAILRPTGRIPHPSPTPWLRCPWLSSPPCSIGPPWSGAWRMPFTPAARSPGRCDTPRCFAHRSASCSAQPTSRSRI